MHKSLPRAVSTQSTARREDSVLTVVDIHVESVRVAISCLLQEALCNLFPFDRDHGFDIEEGVPGWNDLFNASVGRVSLQTVIRTDFCAMVMRVELKGKWAAQHYIAYSGSGSRLRRLCP
jgi:hypothetical protein